MKRIIITIAFAFLFVVGLIAQDVVYNNAYPTDPTNPDVGLVTSAGSGAGGADESVLQDVSLGMNAFGFAHQTGSNFTVAEEFTLDQDCDLQTVMFYAYQTGSSTTSTITGTTVRIWDGDPSAGGSVIWGDHSTNVLVSSTWSGIYRVTETSMGNSQRPIMAIETAVPTTLSAGTYWIEWQMSGSLGSGPWAPPITVVGNNSTGNALQSSDNGSTFGSMLDSGTNTSQGLPFIITAATKNLEVVPTMGEWGLISLGMLLMIFGVVAVGQRKTAIA